MIIYETIYKPWIDNKEEKPWKYIGSDSKNLKEYYGSVSSYEWKDFWKKEIKNNPENFIKTTIACCIINNKNDLLKLEYEIQKQYLVVESKQYFNKTYATTGPGKSGNHKKTEKTKQFLKELRAKQVFPEGHYKKVGKTMSTLIWMNDGVRSYRIKPENVELQKESGLVNGRLRNYIDDKYKNDQRKRVLNQWQKVKKSGHLGNLIKV
jgi:hypothetical protein